MVFFEFLHILRLDVLPPLLRTEDFRYGFEQPVRVLLAA